MTSKRANPSALSKPVRVSKELARIVSSDRLSRIDIVKGLWKYIKSHNRQKEGDAQTIVPDSVLAPVLGSQEINMFKMSTKLKDHIFSE